jgi:peptide/nickel transport system substrate-binding protein
MAQRSIAPVNPKKSYYASDIQALPFSIEAAKKTLADAGWTDTNNDGTVDKVINGQRKELVIDLLTTVEIEVNKMLSNLIAQNAGKAGIKINLNAKNIQEITKLTKEGNFEMALYASAVHPGYPELSQNYGGSNTPDKGGDNRGGFQNAEFDALLTKIRGTRDTKLREQYYQEAQRVFYREMPEIVLFSSDYRVIVSKKFKPVLSSARPGYYEHLFQLK